MPQESGSSIEASLEKLIPALGSVKKENEPEDPKQFADNAANVEQQTVAQPKPEPASAAKKHEPASAPKTHEPASAPKKHSPVVKETPASQRHSPRTSSQERKPPTEQSPRRETQQQQQQRVQQQRQQQRQQPQEQRKVKAVGTYERERKQTTNQESYHDSKQVRHCFLFHNPLYCYYSTCYNLSVKIFTESRQIIESCNLFTLKDLNLKMLGRRR